MSIQFLKKTASMNTLEDRGSVPVPLSEPACRVRGLDVRIPGSDVDAGVWECSPGRFQRQVASGEVMHILSGACSFTPTGGEPVQIGAGDTLFFPANTTGVWHIRETVRKVFVLV